MNNPAVSPVSSPYTPPCVEVCTVAVERGYAVSLGAEEFIDDSEIIITF